MMDYGLFLGLIGYFIGYCVGQWESWNITEEDKKRPIVEELKRLKNFLEGYSYKDLTSITREIGIRIRILEEGK